MFLIFKPVQSIQQVQLLDPDGFYKKNEQEYEELLASKILKARQEDIVLPNKINKPKLINVLKTKLQEIPLADEVSGSIRKQRLQSVILILMMED